MMVPLLGAAATFNGPEEDAVKGPQNQKQTPSWPQLVGAQRLLYLPLLGNRLFLGVACGLNGSLFESKR